MELGEFRQPSGKLLIVWALEGDFDLASFKSNTFRMEWPPKSARFEDFRRRTARNGSMLKRLRVKSPRGSDRFSTLCSSCSVQRRARRPSRTADRSKKLWRAASDE